MKGSIVKKIIMFSIATLIGTLQIVEADEHGHSPHDKSNKLQVACKAECPDAKSDHEAHDCLRKLLKKDKSKKLSSTSCFKALQEHEADEKKHSGHKH